MNDAVNLGLTGIFARAALQVISGVLLLFGVGDEQLWSALSAMVLTGLTIIWSYRSRVRLKETT